jgi:peptidoglycan/LPS O-acetylase OafA/YrhL
VPKLTSGGDSLDILNSLRAVAALMVCLFHSAFLLEPFFPTVASILDIGQYGVYVFFVISGMVIPLALEKSNYSLRDFPVFMTRRIIRLMPPLIVSASIVALSSWLVLDIETIELIRQWAASISLTAPLLNIPFVNEVYWTLYVEMQYYIYIALAFPLLHRASIQWQRVLLLSILALSFVSLLTGGYEKSKLHFQLPVFLIGYITFLYYRERISKSEFFAWLLLCTGVCYYLVGYLHGFGYRIGTIAALTSMTIAHVHRGWRPLSAIGEYSYSFYLIHWPIISALCYVASGWMEITWGAIILFLLVQLVALVCARLFYRIVERPSMNWSRKIAYRHKN